MRVNAFETCAYALLTFEEVVPLEGAPDLETVEKIKARYSFAIVSRFHKIKSLEERL